MRIWGLALGFVGGLLLTGQAQAADCAKDLASAASAFERKVQRLESAHQVSLDKSMQRASANVDSASAAALQKTIDTLVQRADPAGARQAFVVNTLALLSDEAALLNAGVPCSDMATVRKTYNANFETYEAVLGQIELDVEERLAIETLGADEGLVILAVNSDEFIHHALINRMGSLTGSITFGPVRAGEYFRVIKAKQGTYRWEEIMQRWLFRRERDWQWVEGKRRYELADRDFTFTVTAGKLNYVGVFMLDTLQNNYYRPSFNDRLTIVVTALEQRYPGLLARYEFANGLHPEDRFTDFYLAEKRRRLEGTADAP